MSAMSEHVRADASRTRRTDANRPTLCFFYSPTSGPSRRVEAFLAQVLQRRQNHRTFELQRVNCDKHPEHVKRYAITHEEWRERGSELVAQFLSARVDDR